MALVFPKAQARAVLNDLVAATAILNGAKINLFQNDVQVGPETLLTDLTVADYTGYAESSAVTWGAAFTNSQGKAQVTGSVKYFPASGSVVTNTIYGMFCVDAADALVYAENFETPVIVADVGDSVEIVPVVTLI